MGRQVRRVPLDFDWPLDRTWDGYLMPDRLSGDFCPDCYRLDYLGRRGYGSGETASAKWLHAALYLVGMMADDIQAQSFEGTEHQHTAFGDDRSRLHPYLADLQRINVYEHRRPSADIIDLVTGIIGHSRASFRVGSDFFAYRAAEALKSAAGLPDTWGICQTCDGHGSVEKYPGQRADAEAWEPTEPPTGEGYQLWETVSEGSPISPVFDTAEGLARWMASPAYMWGASSPMRYEDALTFVSSDGWAPSLVVSDGRITSGEQWIAEHAEGGAS